MRSGEVAKQRSRKPPLTESPGRARESGLQEIAATVRGRGFMLLADGTERTCALCSVEVEQDDGRKRVHQALALDGDPLLGMTFLRGRQLHVESGEGGEVVIKSCKGSRSRMETGRSSNAPALRVSCWV